MSCQRGFTGELRCKRDRYEHVWVAHVDLSYHRSNNVLTLRKYTTKACMSSRALTCFSRMSTTVRVKLFRLAETFFLGVLKFRLNPEWTWLLIRELSNDLKMAITPGWIGDSSRALRIYCLETLSNLLKQDISASNSPLHIIMWHEVHTWHDDYLVHSNVVVQIFQKLFKQQDF